MCTRSDSFSPFTYLEKRKYPFTALTARGIRPRRRDYIILLCCTHVSSVTGLWKIATLITNTTRVQQSYRDLFFAHFTTYTCSFCLNEYLTLRLKLSFIAIVDFAIFVRREVHGGASLERVAIFHADFHYLPRHHTRIVFQIRTRTCRKPVGREGLM